MSTSTLIKLCEQWAYQVTEAGRGSWSHRVHVGTWDHVCGKKTENATPKKRTIFKCTTPLRHSVHFRQLTDFTLEALVLNPFQPLTPWTFLAIFHPAPWTLWGHVPSLLRHAQTHATSVPVPVLVDDAGKPPRDTRAGINAPSRPHTEQP